jgi:hypothetical protein
LSRHAPRAFAAALTLFWLAGLVSPAGANVVPGSPTAPVEQEERPKDYVAGGAGQGPLLEKQMADDPESVDAIPVDDRLLDYVAGIFGERPAAYAPVTLDMGVPRAAERVQGPVREQKTRASDSPRGHFPRPLDFVGAGAAMLSAATLFRRRAPKPA